MIPDKITERDVPLNVIHNANFKKGGGNGGGSMTGNLERRVEQLEKDTNQIKLDVSVLTTRSENFATKADIETLRTEIAVGHGKLSADLAAGDGSLRAEMAEGFGNLRTEMAGNQGKVNTEFEKLRTEQQALRSELSEKVEAASRKASTDLNSFKNALFWKIGLPLFLILLGGFASVVWAVLKIVTPLK